MEWKKKKKWKCWSFHCVQLFGTPWLVHQAPLSLGFSRQEHWSELPCPPPGDLPNPGTEPWSPVIRHILHHLSHQETHIFLASVMACRCFISVSSFSRVCGFLFCLLPMAQQKDHWPSLFRGKNECITIKRTLQSPVSYFLYLISSSASIFPTKGISERNLNFLLLKCLEYVLSIMLFLLSLTQLYYLPLHSKYWLLDYL